MVSFDHLLDPFPDLVLPHYTLEVSPAPLVSSSSSNIPADFESVVSVSDAHVDILPATPTVSIVIPPRNSTRHVKPLSYLQDYQCSMVSHKPLPNSTSSYPLSTVLSYNSLLASHRAFVLVISSQFEP